MIFIVIDRGIHLCSHMTGPVGAVVAAHTCKGDSEQGCGCSYIYSSIVIASTLSNFRELRYLLCSLVTFYILDIRDVQVKTGCLWAVRRDIVGAGDLIAGE